MTDLIASEEYQMSTSQMESTIEMMEKVEDRLKKRKASENIANFNSAATTHPTSSSAARRVPHYERQGLQKHEQRVRLLGGEQCRLLYGEGATDSSLDDSTRILADTLVLYKETELVGVGLPSI